MEREIDDITGEVVDAAVKLHQRLGPGLLKSVYEMVLARELGRRGLDSERQKPVSFEFDGMRFEDGFRVDLLVEGVVVVELKSVDKLAPVHSKQVLTYLRLLNLPVGLLINFGAATLKEGLHRIVNHFSLSASPRLRVSASPREPKPTMKLQFDASQSYRLDAADAMPITRGAARRAGPALGRRLLTAAVVAWFAVLILFPALALVRAALAGGFGPFLEALASPDARRAFGLTFGITAVATAVNTVFGLAFAVVLVRHRFWGKTLADGLVDLPFAVSPIIAGLMLVILYGPQGWLGRWLEAAGIHVVYAWPGMVLATTFVTLPFVVREVVPVLREFGVDQEEVAYTLGAGRWRTFWQVTLPSIRWGLAYGVTLTVARSLGEFGALLVVSGNIIARTQTATLYVHDGIDSFNTEGAYAASLLLAGISFALLIGMEAIRKRVESHEGPE
jgi:sulfate transport system permease protein